MSPLAYELDSGSILVQVEGLRVQEGSIALMVFDREEGFPKEKEKAVYRGVFPVTNGIPEIRIENLPPGRYAIVMIHDVNGNKDLDKNFFGVPTEPFGFSGEHTMLFGPPKFEEAAFELKSGEVISTIKLIQLF